MMIGQWEYSEGTFSILGKTYYYYDSDNSRYVKATPANQNLYYSS